MNVIVNDTGYNADDWTGAVLDLTSGTDPGALPDEIATVGLIRVEFAGFADGRGFGLARRLRLMGYPGRLRTRGDLIADQYAMARRAGFDEVEISAELAARQPKEQWLRRARWQAHDYQARLRGSAARA